LDGSKKKEVNRLTNRKIAKALDAIELVANLPTPARDIFMDSMHYLSRDISSLYEQEEGHA